MSDIFQIGKSCGDDRKVIKCEYCPDVFGKESCENECEWNISGNPRCVQKGKQIYVFLYYLHKCIHIRINKAFPLILR